jgi:hypothetical protein
MNVEDVPAEAGPLITQITYHANGHDIEVTP